jgi:hypothetical protein
MIQQPRRWFSEHLSPCSKLYSHMCNSLIDFKMVLNRLAKNKVLLFNSFSSVFYMFGFIGYWTFMPKYMETQFRQSASKSSLITGTTLGPNKDTSIQLFALV